MFISNAVVLRRVLPALLALTFALAAVGPTPAWAQVRRWDASYFPNVPVVTQDGVELKFYDDVIKGKLVVISFIFTSCRDICPLVTARLAQVREQLGEAQDRYTFVSITIDPEHDGPAQLKAHADAFHVGPGWLFLTGKPEDIREIRYKLGERSRTLTEHRNEVVLGNDINGSWARDSAFTDLNVLAATILTMHRSASPLDDQAKREAAKVVRSDAVLPGQALYTKACAGCHTIGLGDRVGPDLNGVTQRRDRAWLTRFLIEPDKVRASNDEITVELISRFKSVRMPTLGLSSDDAIDLLAYLDAQTYRVSPPASIPPAEPAAAHLHRHH